MNITICTAHRQSVGHLSRYFEQIEGLQRLLTRRGDLLNLVIGYGDSTDGTAEWLFDYCSYSIGALLIDCTHGGKRFGSVVDAQRFRQLAYVANRMWANIPADSDVVVILDGDLIWDPSTLLALIDDTATYPVVAPMVMDSPPKNTFYDVWAFRRSGAQFRKRPPYHPDLPIAGGYLQLDSAGACIAIRGDLARQVRFPEDDVVVGLCRQVYERGGTIFLDTKLKVFHL